MRIRAVPSAWSLVFGLAVLLPAARTQDPGIADAQRAAGALAIERLAEKDDAVAKRIRSCPREAVLLVDGRHDLSQ